MTETPVAQTSPAPDDQTIAWLRKLAAHGGKGVVNNIDARSIGRLADGIESLQATVRELRHEIDEALMLTESCSSLKQLSAAFVELTARTAAAEAENKRLRKVDEIRKVAVNRWVPCPGHRDKTERGICYVCENERLIRFVERAHDACADPSRPRQHVGEILAFALDQLKPKQSREPQP